MQDADMQGIRIGRHEHQISQVADDTVLLLASFDGVHYSVGRRASENILWETEIDFIGFSRFAAILCQYLA